MAYRLQSIMKGRQDKNQKAETQAAAIEFAFLYTPGPPAQGCHHPQWARFSRINHQSRKFSIGLPTGHQLNPSSQMTLVYVKLFT